MSGHPEEGMAADTRWCIFNVLAHIQRAFILLNIHLRAWNWIFYPTCGHIYFPLVAVGDTRSAPVHHFC